MLTNEQELKMVRSYMSLRKAVGWIGILLPFVLMIGLIALFRGCGTLDSISLYYYSRMRNVLVGALCGIGFFLFFYRGYDNWKKTNWDEWITNIGGVLAIAIAFCPTTECGKLDLKGIFHFIFAAVFFILLACYSIFVFTRSTGKMSRQKKVRNKIYVACGIVMILSMIAIGVYVMFIESESRKYPVTFWSETIALAAFGLSWLTKGGTISPDKSQ
ncbi:MAG TPA: hypothetical protein VMT63_12665 [Bacteroidales bacterium]|nr:hypothetical protein [Bacteroidales bacterium]